MDLEHPDPYIYNQIYLIIIFKNITWKFLLYSLIIDMQRIENLVNSLPSYIYYY